MCAVYSHCHWLKREIQTMHYMVLFIKTVEEQKLSAGVRGRRRLWGKQGTRLLVCLPGPISRTGWLWNRYVYFEVTRSAAHSWSAYASTRCTVVHKTLTRVYIELCRVLSQHLWKQSWRFPGSLLIQGISLRSTEKDELQSEEEFNLTHQ